MWSYAVSQGRGQRSEMEDTYDTRENPAGSGVLYGGVFDGHRGEKAAHVCERKLGNYFLDQLFTSARPQRNARAAFEEAYRQLGSELAEEISGSCAATFCLDGEMLTVGNIGDCRILLVDQDGWHQLTVDHTPDNPEERKRIFEHAGPEKLHQRGSGRLCLLDAEGGMLSITRSFGDVTFRRSGVTYVPHTSERRLTGREICLIAATDGLFCAVSNEEVAGIARTVSSTAKLTEILKETAEVYDSTDNITIIAVNLRK